MINSNFFSDWIGGLPQLFFRNFFHIWMRISKVKWKIVDDKLQWDTFYLFFQGKKTRKHLFIYPHYYRVVLFSFSSFFVQLQMIILLGNDHLWCCNLSMSQIRMTWILLTHTHFQLGWINIYFHSIDKK